MSSAAADYEQAGELKIGQVGIANLRIRTLDVARLADEMRDRVQRAPKLFARAAVVLDFGGLSQT
ncbi:MAG: septum site-determining protein MinC, partial [Lysobacter sp.]|nr:septum site-determining protein MinC [Lysobacter sp.]